MNKQNTTGQVEEEGHQLPPRRSPLGRDEQQPSSAASAPEGVASRAAHERVTAEEFADALAALETREQALRDTVPIGEALQQLGITGATPEEVWAQVRAQREQPALRQQSQEHERERRPRQGRRRRRAAAAALGAAALIAGGLLSLVGRHQTREAFVESPAPVTAPVPANATAAGALRTLAEVPDERFVECTPETLVRLLRAGPSAAMTPPVSSDAPGASQAAAALAASEVIVRELGAHPRNGWLLIKHGGRVYVRGYTAAMSPGAMAALGKIRIYSGRLDNTGAGGLAYLEPITLRVGSFRFEGRDPRPASPASSFRTCTPTSTPGRSPSFKTRQEGPARRQASRPAGSRRGLSRLRLPPGVHPPEACRRIRSALSRGGEWRRREDMSDEFERCLTDLQRRMLETARGS
jgi:hypothetical protein